MAEAKHKLTKQFRAFFKRVNPSQTYEDAAASAHNSIRSLIENTEGPAADLRIRSFLQGSYRRETAIHTINDVDVVALCSLSYKPSANRATRDQIFHTISEAVASDQKYADKIRYGPDSMCVKILLAGVKVEVLPALRVAGKPYQYEPFRIFQPDDPGPDSQRWRLTFARHHQKRCSTKNSQCDGRFIPIIKCFKHLRSIDPQLADGDAVSFHLECLLYAVRDAVYDGSAAEYIESVLEAVAAFTPDKAQSSGVKSPCGDKTLFHSPEWSRSSYDRFHQAAQQWHALARSANQQDDEDGAIEEWQDLLGKDYFPKDPA